MVAVAAEPPPHDEGEAEPDRHPHGRLDRRLARLDLVRLAVQHQEVDQQQREDDPEQDRPVPRLDVEVDEARAAVGSGEQSTITRRSYPAQPAAATRPRLRLPASAWRTRERPPHRTVRGVRRHAVRAGRPDDGLGGGQAGDRHAERRAADVVEAGVVEQGDRLRVAAVLAAHAELEVGLGLAPEAGADAHELADAVGVDGLERVALQQALLQVGRHHPALDVVAGEPERHLGEVVGAEAEEVGLLGDLVGTDRGPRRLDHRADRDVRLLAHVLEWPDRSRPGPTSGPGAAPRGSP